MELKQRVELLTAPDQLAELLHAGQPLALFNMRPQWIRLSQALSPVLLGIVICAVLFILIVFALFFHELLHGSIPDLQFGLLMNLSGTIPGLMVCIFLMITRHVTIRNLPASLLVCAEGLLILRPKGVEVIRWDEVKGVINTSVFSQEPRYVLFYRNRQSLHFDSFENIEDLVALIKQQPLKGWE